jgi:hypothetical protein
MKNTNSNATYESPVIDFLLVESEGVLCESNAKGKHNGYNPGTDIFA